MTSALLCQAYLARRRSLLRWRWSVWLLALPLLWLAPAQAQSPTPAACAAPQHTAVPPADTPDLRTQKTLQACDAEALYYGFGQRPDFTQARQCAYLQRAKNDNSSGPFQGAAILSMIYANGQGVPRNYPLALKFACEAGGAPAEVASRTQHLATLARGTSQSEFDFCDDITSGYMEGFCAQRDARFRNAKRSQQLGELIYHWSAAKRKAFGELQSAAQHFFEVRAEAEVDLSGSGRAAFEIEERGKLNDDFTAALDQFERGKLPAATQAEFARADQQLNAIYARALSVCSKAPQDGSVTADGIRSSQRAWLLYRDAWVKFGSLAYPKVSAVSWQAWTTEQRIRQLRDLAQQN